MALALSLSLFALCRGVSALDAQFDGCDEVLDGPVCEITAATSLQVWLDVSDADLRWTLDDKSLTSSAAATAGGFLFTLPVNATTATLQARDIANDTLFELALASATPNSAARDATTAMRRGDLTEALSIADAGIRRAAGRDKAAQLRVRAQIYARLEQRTKSHADFRAAILQSRTHGQRYTEVLSATALAYSLRHDMGDTVAAQDLLRTLEGRDQGHAASAFFTRYHLATLRFHFEDVRGHLTGMRAAANVAQRFDWSTRLLRTHGRMAVQWLHLGRRDTARTLLGTWENNLPNNVPDSDRVAFWNSLAWSEVLALEANETRGDAQTRLHYAADLSQRLGSEPQKVNALVNLGLGQWHAGQRDAANQTLEHIDQFPTPRAPHLRFWLLDLRARVALMNSDHASADAFYEQMWQLASALSLPGEQWRALVRKAWLLESQGQELAALDAYAQAERFLDLEVLNVPLHEGRESLLATRRFADHRQFDLLVRHQRGGDALKAMRRHQARARRWSHIAAQLSALDATQRQTWDDAVEAYHATRNQISQHYADSWSWSAAELARRNENLSAQQHALRAQLDRAVLALAHASPPTSGGDPVDDINASTTQPAMAIMRTAGGWTALVDNGDQVLVFSPKCEAATLARSASCLIEATRPGWRDAQQVMLLVDGELQAIDWHALKLEDGLWLDHVAVRYSAALTRTERASPVPGLALLVADPTRNLGGARAEITTVANTLTQKTGWSSSVLQGTDVTSPQLRDALSGAALFHYAGHATYGHTSGWDSALMLAHDNRFGVGDILTLTDPPQIVVLSGCETATRPGVDVPSMGLANAFIVAGSAAVIATSRSVDDASANAVTQAFYRHWLQGADVAQALRIAQRQVRDSNAAHDWAAFRLIQP